jgi:hypothetical protein
MTPNPTTPFERIKSCADLLEAYFGARLTTVSQDTQFTMGTAPVRIMPQNARRIAWWVVNNIGNTGAIGLWRDNTVSAAKGFASSDVLDTVFSWHDLGDSVIEELWAFGTVPTDSICVREILLT